MAKCAICKQTLGENFIQSAYDESYCMNCHVNLISGNLAEVPTPPKLSNENELLLESLAKNIFSDVQRRYGYDISFLFEKKDVVLQEEIKFNYIHHTDDNYHVSINIIFSNNSMNEINEQKLCYYYTSIEIKLYDPRNDKRHKYPDLKTPSRIFYTCEHKKECKFFDDVRYMKCEWDIGFFTKQSFTYRRHPNVIF